MKSLRAWLACLSAALVMVGCGGGSGTPLVGPVDGPKASDLTVSLSAQTVTNQANASVLVTVTAVDANRATISGVPVTLSVDAGATINASALVTSATGTITATLGLGGNLTPRQIKVTAISGGITKTATVTVTSSTAVQATDLVVTLSAPVIANTVSAEVKVTVMALDSNRAALAGIPVTVSVNAGATVQITSGTTDDAGMVTGIVRVGSDLTPRKITLTAVSGAITRSTVIDVVAVTAADLTLTLSPSAILSNSGTANVIATATAVDGNRATVAGIPVTLSVDSAATIQTSGAVSNTNGQVTGTVSIGADKSNRTITVTAVSGAIVRTAVIQVIGAKLVATVLGAVLAPNQTGGVQYRLVDANGNPIAGKQLTVIGPGGVQTIATTGTNGEYDYSFRAPANAGSLDIRASAAGVESLVTVLVNSGIGTIPKVTTTVRSASVSANPSVIPINSATTTNRSEIRALFLSDSNAPVKDIRVRFDLDSDRNSIGGTFTSGTTQVYSDVNGVATAAYVPGSRFSPTDGVTVRACWDYDDFAASACPNAVRTTLTVISDALSVTIGTNNLIEEGSSKLTYVTRYVVQVVDSSGLAAKDVQVSALIDLLEYYKGIWQRGAQAWFQVKNATCANEDLNRNGVAEIFSNGVVEDANGSFNLIPGRPALEPRKADVAVSFEGSSKTNASGQVVMRIEYPQNVGSWVRFNIIVSASGVAGTEGRANFDDVLNVPAAVVNRLDAEPPFVRSPYGVLASPTVMGVAPGSGKPAVALCTNPN